MQVEQKPNESFLSAQNFFRCFIVISIMEKFWHLRSLFHKIAKKPKEFFLNSSGNHLN